MLDITNNKTILDWKGHWIGRSLPTPTLLTWEGMPPARSGCSVSFNLTLKTSWGIQSFS